MGRMLTESFSLAEFVVSETAERKNINNSPSDLEIGNLLNITAPNLQKIRNLLGKPINITSGYRCFQLNKAVGGAPDSAHLRGLGVDFISPQFGTPKEVCQFLASRVKDLHIDQLIYEGSWIHVGYAAVGVKPRGEVLTARFVNGKAQYLMGIV